MRLGRVKRGFSVTHNLSAAAIMLAIYGCSPNNSVDAKREQIGKNWTLLTSNGSGRSFVALEQDDDVIYGAKKAEMLEGQSFSLICDRENNSFKATLTPIARMYENQADTVDVSILATRGLTSDQLLQNWENAYSERQDTPGKYITSTQQDALKLVQFMLRAYQEKKYSVSFIFAGDEEGKSTDLKNGAIQIDVRIDGFSLAIKKMRRACGQGRKF
jgi:hypothetical protein